ARSEVRDSARRNLYTGKTYNSLENIAQFFAEHGVKQQPKPAPAPKAAVAWQGPARKSGSTVNHPKYGRGTIVRREGEGEDAKLTVSFPHHGLKKLIAKYAGLTD